MRNLPYRTREEGPVYDSRRRLRSKRGSLEWYGSRAGPESRSVRTVRDETINRILRELEISAAPQQPHLVPVLEAVRQAYNHRDYLYDICRELASTRPAGEKIENMKDRTADEIKAELVGLLTTGGIQSVSSQLRELRFFERPFGAHGPNLDARTSAVFQEFFESSVAEVIEMGSSA
jgi:hypothetical protein